MNTSPRMLTGMAAALLLFGCDPDGSGTVAATGSDASSGSDATTGSDAAVGTDATTTSDSGGNPFPGTVLFTENFEDTNFDTRGWYDGPSADLSTVESIPGSTSSFECRFMPGAMTCAGGTPGRHMFADTESGYLSYWVKYSANWVGSGVPYHPHEFHFITNENGMWVGPAFTRLTTYIEQIGGVPHLALQDGENVDLSCVLLNNDSFVGCGGDFATYMFTEDRSVCSCNGLMGDLDGRDCFPLGNGDYYSSRSWSSPIQAFGDGPGPYDRNEWHFVEAYFQMNTIVGGIAVPDGVIRYWFDGELLISSDAILMRTGMYPNMAFNQFLVAPYIGVGSPVDQTMWVDDLTVATGRP